MLKRYFEAIDNKKKEERRRARARNRKNVAAAFAIGSIISGAAALLFAPKSGKELRKDIAEKSAEGAEIVKKTAVTGYAKASEFTNSVIDKAKAALGKNGAQAADAEAIENSEK